MRTGKNERKGTHLECSNYMACLSSRALSSWGLKIGWSLEVVRDLEAEWDEASWESMAGRLRTFGQGPTSWLPGEWALLSPTWKWTRCHWCHVVLTCSVRAVVGSDPSVIAPSVEPAPIRTKWVTCKLQSARVQQLSSCFHTRWRESVCCLGHKPLKATSREECQNSREYVWRGTSSTRSDNNMKGTNTYGDSALLETFLPFDNSSLPE